MTRAFLVILAVIIAALFITTTRRLWQAARARKAARADFLGGIVPLLSTPRLRQEPSGFPRLAGEWQGRPFDFQAVPDTLTFRKLPALWLLVTLTAPQQLRGETRIMARPSGQEPFSTHDNLPFATALPEGFPDYCALKTTAPEDLPPPAVMAAIAPLFDDPAVKEVVLSHKGLRMVRLAEEAPRGSYLIYRDAELGRAPLPPQAAMQAMAALLMLETSLKDNAHG